MLRTLMFAFVLAAACGEDHGGLQSPSRRADTSDTVPITMPPAMTLAEWERLGSPTFYDFRPGTFYTVINRAPLDSDGRPSEPGWHAYGADLGQQKIAFHLRLDTVDDLLAFQHKLEKQLTRAAVAHPTDGIHHGMAVQLDTPPPSPCCQPGGDAWAQSIVQLGSMNAANTAAAFNGDFFTR